MSDRPTGVRTDRAMAALMARAVMFVMFLGSGITLVLMLMGSSAALPFCVGAGVVTLIVLMIGAYYVARAKASV